MVAKVVIGANFGDEGKGLMTDYFCHQSVLRGEKCLVVLHNGGAQRGHTVVTLDGKRHIFHHFGSGTFVGADTFLSEDFILNPMVFRQEWEELEEMGITPKVYVNHACKVTTPFDMILNQIKEEQRSEKRHGSCGMGIFETINRYCCNFNVETWARDNKKQNIHYLRRIRNDYFLRIIKNMDLDLSDEWAEIVFSDSLIERFVEDLRFMALNIKIPNFSDREVLKKYDCLVFEGGQGLLLDQNNKDYFPHLTPSNTGIKNPLKIISNMSCQPDIEVCYVTRTYITRHGAGRLDGECNKVEINPGMQDLTNVPNPHQGTLRYAKLEEESLKERILKDFEPARQYGAKLSLAVTHQNEYDYVFSDGYKKNFDYIYFSNREIRESVLKMGGHQWLVRS
jgi:adenylosuccinate synthase